MSDVRAKIGSKALAALGRYRGDLQRMDPEGRGPTCWSITLGCLAIEAGREDLFDEKTRTEAQAILDRIRKTGAQQTLEVS